MENSTVTLTAQRFNELVNIEDRMRLIVAYMQSVKYVDDKLIMFMATGKMKKKGDDGANVN